MRIKATTIFFLFVCCLLLGSLKAQNPKIYYHNQLRALFENLARPTTSSDFLYEMSMKTSDTSPNPVIYDDISNEINDVNTWMNQYQEVRYMAYDTTVLPRLEDFAESVLLSTASGNTVPLGLIHINSLTFKPNALTTDDYFYFDTLNDILTDKYPRPTPFPFDNKSIFSASGLVLRTKNYAPTFTISPNFFVLDSYTESYYNQPGYTLAIDFGDGNGFQLFASDASHTQTINYGSGGGKVIKVELRPETGGQTIAAAQYRIAVGNVPPPPPPSTIYFNQGLRVDLFDGCQAENSGRKIAVIVEGFDFFETGSSYDTYKNLIAESRIDELKRFGYEFHVVDWNNSKLDMRTNAAYLMEYLDKLKCELLAEGNYEPMVVIGHSMGGVIAKYALTKLEFDPSYSACNPEYLHFVRLLITLDSPHQGANIPMAYQHFYQNKLIYALGSLGFHNEFTRKIASKINVNLLNSTAAKQLLLYHHSAPGAPGIDYLPNSARAQFLADLNDIGGFPQHCKTMAVSSGSGISFRQLNSFTSAQRIPGDDLLRINHTISGRILWFEIDFSLFDLHLKTSDGSNEVFNLDGFITRYRLRLRLFGVEPVVAQNITLGYHYGANMYSYDVETGGSTNIGFFEELLLDPPNTQLGLSVPFVGSFSLNQNGIPGIYNIGWISNFGFYSHGASVTLYSDGLGFCFIPIRSALDYGDNIYTGPKNPNLETTAPIASMANTPFDVILAVSGRNTFRFETGKVSHSNTNHSNVYNPKLYFNFPNDSILYRTCWDDRQVSTRLLNREIGDEKFFLENFTQLFPYANYPFEYDIYVNEPNPIYNYTNGYNSSKSEHSAISKSEPFETNFTANFYSDQSSAVNYSPPYTSSGYIYNSPLSPNTIYYNQPYYICCDNPKNLRKKAESSAKEEDNRLQLKHRVGKLQYFTYRSVNRAKAFKLQLIDLSGRILLEQEMTKSTSELYFVPLKGESQFLLLRILDENEIITQKIHKL